MVRGDADAAWRRKSSKSTEKNRCCTAHLVQLIFTSVNAELI
jgi:hypothetical protein